MTAMRLGSASRRRSAHSTDVTRSSASGPPQRPSIASTQSRP